MKLDSLLAMDAAISREIKSRDDIQKYIFALTEKTGRDMEEWHPERYKKKWLASERFYLMAVSVSKVNNARPPHYKSIVASKMKKRHDDPIVIDANIPRNYQSKRHPGKWPGKHLVMDGCHRLNAAIALKDETIPAYVGEKCLQDFL